jgi:hypothetical protein
MLLGPNLAGKPHQDSKENKMANQGPVVIIVRAPNGPNRLLPQFT